MQQLDELVGILIVRHDLFLDFQLLLQDGHVAVHLGQLGLERPQHVVFSNFVLDLDGQLLIGLVQRIEINVVIGGADHKGRNKQDSCPRC